MSEGGCGNETVFDRHRSAERTEMRQEFRPTQSRLCVPWDAVNASGDFIEPAFEFFPPPSGWKQEDPEANFPQDHRVDDKVAFVTRQPLDDPCVRTGLCRLAQHIGIDQTRHDGPSSESVDSDSIGVNQPFAGQASSVSTKP